MTAEKTGRKVILDALSTGLGRVAFHRMSDGGTRCEVEIGGEMRLHRNWPANHPVGRLLGLCLGMEMAVRVANEDIAELQSQVAQLLAEKENPAGAASPSGEAGRPEAKA